MQTHYVIIFCLVDSAAVCCALFDCSQKIKYTIGNCNEPRSPIWCVCLELDTEVCINSKEKVVNLKGVENPN